MRALPSKLPSAFALNSGQSPVPPDVDVGGYDVMIGGHGFRLATDQQFAYQRATEPTTVHRFDSSLEPGEQSLSPLPWLKSQSSFHGGAGQLNAEEGFTAFEYQQEKVEHIRFDNCLGVDVWTPGKVTRLPDTRFFNFGFNSTCSVAATLNGIDYAIIGGVGGLFQAAWLSGPDANPTVTRISLVNSTYLNDANCTITSLASDGANYFGVVQMTAVGYNPNILTYIFAGQVDSTATPEAIYRVPNLLVAQTLHNTCPNPSLENNTTGWHSFNWSGTTLTQDTGGATIARSTLRAAVGTASLEVTCSGSYASNVIPVGFGEGGLISVPTTTGQIYTVSVQAYVPAATGVPVQVCAMNTAGTSYIRGSATTAFDTWQTLEITFTAQAGTATYVGVSTASTAPVGSKFYFDAVMSQIGSWLTINYFDGNTTDTPTYNYTWDGTVGNSTSTATALTVVAQTPSIIGWQKARLVGALGRALYELDPAAPVHSDIPAARYTNPSQLWEWDAISESPTGILVAGSAGNQASVLEFSLDGSGGTPFLTGGSSIASLPIGETIKVMEQVVGSWLVVGTNKGVRVGTFDTFTGNLKLGPLSLSSTQPVQDVASRDRFVYAGYTNQQADGKTGLARLDLSMITDAAGRMAYAPDLRPPTSAPTGLGAVTSVNILPQSGRLLFITPEGLHVEGNGPGTSGPGWVRTSRIRYDTAEMKLFKLGRVHGALDVSTIQVTGIAPYGVASNLGSFGFIAGADPGEFRLPTGLNEWIQLQFDLQGSACILNSYQVKAYPAPARQHVIVLTLNCFRQEVDRYGLDVTDPESPRKRLQNVIDLETVGNETRYVEFTNEGAVAQLVLIDDVDYKSFSRPNIEDDFGGYITVRLRTTEG